MREYYKFSRKHFEYGIRKFLIENKLGYLSDITQEFLNEGNNTCERIYKITTKNPSVDIILFSSLTIKNDSVRDNSTDAVRLVVRWKTKNGFVYKRLAKHLRIKTLFDNVEKTISKAQKESFNLNYKEFSKITI